MRLLFTLFFSFIITALYASSGKEVLRYWNVSGASSLEIHGTTNVNSFVCVSDYTKDRDMIMERWNPSDEKWVIHGEVLLDVKDFDCRNRIMNNDFQHTLQSDVYPHIKVEFLELKEVSTQGKSRKAEGVVQITLAGETKRYPISSTLVFLDDYYSILKGEQVFRFSDFGLEAPQKGFGMVRVRDEIAVQFELMLEQVMLTGN